MTPARYLRSLSWAPTVSLSWMWGLGFFYSMHIVWIQGWAGFWVFALANACGLAFFGCALNSSRRDPELLFRRIGPRFALLFLLCQIGAVAITLYSIGTYVWPLLLPNAHAGIAAVLSSLVALVACAVGHASTLRQLRFLHVGYLAFAVVAIVVTWYTLPESSVPGVEIGSPSTLSVWTFLLPTLVGFALGPWCDIQQWQRAIEIRRSGASPAVAYVAGGLVFLALLTANAMLSRSAGASIIVAADGAIGAQGSVAAHLATEGLSPGAIAFVVWVVIAAASTIDSFYCATRWYLSLLISKSMHPALAFVPASAASSPLWVLIAASAVVGAMSSFGLSQTAYMMPFATLLVGATVCLLVSCVLSSSQATFDPVSSYLWGLTAALIFFVGYSENVPFLVPVSTAVALLGAIRPTWSLITERSSLFSTPVAIHSPEKAADDVIGSGQTLPSNAGTVGAIPLAFVATANSNAAPAHGFDGQWFVMSVTPTYDDTNSVGNVYFANYVRWVGKARELFFNACMPKFDLETTRYLVLTKSFQHDFRREIAEFEPAIIRIRIARHNRKFVTLEHEIVSARHGLLGRGEQDLMFVERESFKPLDIPADIVRGFLPFWPSKRLEGPSQPIPERSPMVG